jgi:bis(5'-nucleosyl)-tetraphosphatase (symmetrical)
MSTYAIGDIQGCLDPLKRLLDKIRFDPRRDRLWFTGDLVNRGPKSLETLRFIKSLADSATIVLGNHDLHLLACYYGKRSPHKSDSFGAVLAANDCDELLTWLRQRPLLHYDSNFCLVHAGLAPQWDLSLALRCARQVEKVLQDDMKISQFFDRMYGDTPTRWNEDLEEWSMIRFSVNVLTRMRYCTKDGAIDTKYKGVPGSQPAELMPWFDHPARRSQTLNIVFGHWSTLGLADRNGVYNIDTGCVWGGQLTALRLDPNSREYIQVQCECSKNDAEAGD